MSWRWRKNMSCVITLPQDSGLRRVEPVRRRVVRQVGIHRGLRRHGHRLRAMRDVERIEVHQHRQQRCFGNAEGLQHGVQRLLRALHVILDQPVSRCARLSVWSGQKAQGETVRLMLAITMGARAPLA